MQTPNKRCDVVLCHTLILLNNKTDLYWMQICIARNALAAVIYWCQGKRQCRFPKSYLTDAAKFSQYFVPDSQEVTYRAAEQACRTKKGHLASLKAQTDAANAKDAVVKRDRRNFRGRERFWVSKTTRAHLHRLNVTWAGKSPGDKDCLVLAKNYTKACLFSIFEAQR